MPPQNCSAKKPNYFRKYFISKHSASMWKPCKNKGYLNLVSRLNIIIILKLILAVWRKINFRSEKNFFVRNFLHHSSQWLRWQILKKFDWLIDWLFLFVFLVICALYGLRMGAWMVVITKYSLFLKLSCDSRFQRAFTACICVFKVFTQVWANQGNFFENANACSKLENDCCNSA